MQNIIADLKASRQYFAAGALAYAAGLPPHYGQHFGMKSSRFNAASQFVEGWHDAKANHLAATAEVQ